MRRLFASCLVATAGFVLTPAYADEADELFPRLDKNSDGQLAKDEIDEDKVRLFERLVRVGDKNNDGKLSREEFAAAIKDRPADPAAPAAGPGGDRPAPREIFQRLDANQDGKLSKEEAPERLRQNFDRADRNGDGFITLDELQQAFQALGGAPGKPNGKPDGKPDAKPNSPERKPETQPAEATRKPAEATATPRPLAANFPPFFAALDANRDGELSADEIANASKALAALDMNNDGKLTRDELFPNLPANFRPGEGAGREMLARLREADKDNDGKISRDEAPERIRPLFDRIDANGDGKLDETEIRAMAERLQNSRRPEPKP